MRVTIFSTGRPVSIFTQLHALTLVARFYALLVWVIRWWLTLSIRETICWTISLSSKGADTEMIVETLGVAARPLNTLTSEIYVCCVCVCRAADKNNTQRAYRPTDSSTFFRVAPSFTLSWGSSLKCVNVVTRMRSLWRSSMLTKWSSGRVESKRERVCRMRVRWEAWFVKRSTRKFFRACDVWGVWDVCVRGGMCRNKYYVWCIYM